MLLRVLLTFVRVPAQQQAVMLATAPRVWGGTPSVCNLMAVVTPLRSCKGLASSWRPHTAARNCSRNCSTLASLPGTSVATATLPLTTIPADPQQELAALSNTSPAAQASTLADHAAAAAAAPPPGLVPTGSRLLLLGVDPDGQGAIAALSCDILTQPPAQAQPCHSSSTARPTTSEVAAPCGCAAGAAAAAAAGPGALPAHLDLSSASVALYDMPRMEVPLLTKAKGGKVRTRKRLDIDAVVALVRHLVEQATHQQDSPAPTPPPPAAHSSHAASGDAPSTLESAPSSTGASSSSSSSSSSSALGSGGEAGSSSSGGLVLRAVLEVTGGILPINGMYSIQTSAYIQGAWLGVLRASGFEVCTVPPKQWKRDLGLPANKDASRTLASNVFEAQACLLKHKKDHGRAEALLLAAWGAGLMADIDHSNGHTTSSSNGTNGSATLSDEDTLDTLESSVTTTTSSSSSSSLMAGPCRVHLLCDAAGRVLPPASSLSEAAARLQQVGEGRRSSKGAAGGKASKKSGARGKKASTGASKDAAGHTASSDSSSSAAKRKGRPKKAATPALELDTTSNPSSSSKPSSSSSSSSGDGSSSAKRRGRPKKATAPPLEPEDSSSGKRSSRYPWTVVALQEGLDSSADGDSEQKDSSGV